MIAVQNAPPSTLIDVIVQIKQAMSLMANKTPISVGKQFLKNGVGSGPRVVFVPEASGSAIAPPLLMGNAASMVHSCAVYVRAKEDGDDAKRFANAYDLADLMISLIETAGCGHVEWLPMVDGSPVDSDAYGAELAFAFTYQRDIPHNARRWGLPPADADNSDERPMPPPGVPSDGNTFVPTTDPVT